jgi:hypothetical protein
MSDISAQIRKQFEAWVTAIQRRDFEWFERNLTEDFTVTAHPFPTLSLDRRKFIEVDKSILEIDIDFLRVVATITDETAGIALSHCLAHIKKEVFHADVNKAATAVPDSLQLTSALSGKTVAYASGWRLKGESWQCFDHHLIGAMS